MPKKTAVQELRAEIVALKNENLLLGKTSTELASDLKGAVQAVQTQRIQIKSLSEAHQRLTISEHDLGVQLEEQRLMNLAFIQGLLKAATGAQEIVTSVGSVAPDFSHLKDAN